MKLAIMIVLIQLLAAGIHADTLSSELYKIRKASYGPSANIQMLEEKCLGLLEIFKAPDEIGEIYYNIEFMYTQSHWTDSQGNAKVLQYAAKALEYPLPLSQQVRLLHENTQALEKKYAGVKGGELAKIRREEVVLPALEGIKRTLDNKIPNSTLPLPKNTFTGLHTAGYIYDPEKDKNVEEFHKRIQEQQEAIQKENERFTAELDKVREINATIRSRQICEDRVVAIYTKKPYATAELRQIALRVLEDQSVVERIVNRVSETINERNAKEFQKLPNQMLKKIEVRKLEDSVKTTSK
jgi:hypothetical protein